MLRNVARQTSCKRIGIEKEDIVKEMSAWVGSAIGKKKKWIKGKEWYKETHLN